jgi:hypothetical protein
MLWGYQGNDELALPGFGLIYRKSALTELKFIRGKCLESSRRILDATRQWRNDMGMNTAI